MKLNRYRIVFFSIAFTLFACGEENKPDNIETSNQEINENEIIVSEAQFEQSKMSLGSFVTRDFPTIVSVNGMIDVPPQQRAVVNASLGGYIKTAPLLVGDRVQKGDLLITIESPKFVALQQEYLEVYEQLNYLKAEYDRQVSMKAENITSQKSFLKAESNYKTAVAKHKGLEKQLLMLNLSPFEVKAGNISSITSIYAPISGSITQVNVSIGTYVSPATEILEIIDSDHIHIELSVFEKDIMKIIKGQKIHFKIPESSSDTFKAEVYLVGTSIEANRTIKVHGHLEDESNHNFLTGMFVEAEIITNSDSSIDEKQKINALTDEAIVGVEGIPYVLVLEKKEDKTYHFKKIVVEVKKTYNGYSSVESKIGFDPEVQFLTKGAFSLLGE